MDTVQDLFTPTTHWRGPSAGWATCRGPSHQLVEDDLTHTGESPPCLTDFSKLIRETISSLFSGFDERSHMQLRREAVKAFILFHADISHWIFLVSSQRRPSSLSHHLSGFHDIMYMVCPHLAVKLTTLSSLAVVCTNAQYHGSVKCVKMERSVGHL